jgi:hypothetical protein
MLGIAICSTLAAFTPVPPGDTTPPVISNITVVYDSLIIITWETHEISDSLVKWGRESGLYTLQKYDANLVLSHSVRLEDIREDGTYYFVVMSMDPSGNVAETPEHRFMLTTAPQPVNSSWIESFLLLLILFFILSAISVVILSFVIYKYKERAETLKLKTAELTQRVEDFKKIKAKVLSKPGLEEVKEIRAQVVPEPEQAEGGQKEIRAKAEQEVEERKEIGTKVEQERGMEEQKEIKAGVVLQPEQAEEEQKEIGAKVEQEPAEDEDELKKIKAEAVLQPEQGVEEELKELKAEVEPQPEQVVEELKEIKAKLVAEVKAIESERKGSKTALSIDRIRDVIREKRTSLAIKYIGNPNSPSKEEGLLSKKPLTKHLSADGHVLDKVERKLVLNMKAYTFKVYMPQNEPTGKDFEFENGLLKMTTEALWIIGRASLKRIAGEDLVQVEQMRRSIYQGTEYGALSIEYLDEGGTDTGVRSTTVIAKGNTTEVILKHLQELADAYNLREQLSEPENRILSMLHAGALDLSPSKLALTAQALQLTEEELMNHLERLSEQGVIDLANQTMRKKGIKYLLVLSKIPRSGVSG